MGIGINTSLTKKELPKDLRKTVTSFTIENVPVHRQALLQEVLLQLERYYEIAETEGFKPILAEWKVLSMIEAVKKYTSEDFGQVTTIEEARAIADKLHVEYTEHCGIGKIINACFEDYVEENLMQPTIITGHPLEISPLTKQDRENPLLTYRFEGFIYGRELANGFSELNDPIDQRDRFVQQMKERAMGDDEAHQMDEDFVRALEYGLPPTGGLGIGIDRLVMYFKSADAIVARRYHILCEALGIPEDNSPTNAKYYTIIDIYHIAEQKYGKAFRMYLEKNVEQIDFLVRLSKEKGLVLMAGMGFDAPAGTLRISQANLPDEDYRQIGIRILALLEEYYRKYSRS